ncbi:pyridoxamine 5'-phosphate oxidase family protein [Brevibacterium daeguense]|uniref:Pyridoxamine 5'-phosphate oxidase family protein n=1 Tax=Brevibacterium daeguense TaxID=909936 RepID=A0ABP8EJI8_9MICO|nr:pyridoxamine 5'-phosphate oxidase family protein [Brevibacterium daeguense]
MADHHDPGSAVTELSADQCWELLRSGDVARLAVIVDDHPDIFPVNYVVDSGTVVFRSAPGTKLTAALAGPVAFEVDGYEQQSGKAWSVVLKGRAQQMRDVDELNDSFDLPLFPWQAGRKGTFVRVEAASITGRRFPVAARSSWTSPYRDRPRTAPE